MLWAFLNPCGKIGHASVTQLPSNLVGLAEGNWMMTAETVNIVNAAATVVVAVATIIVVILAIWGDYFRARFAGPKLSLVPHNPVGFLSGQDIGSRTIYYHLRVVNAWKWVSATNCQVLLKKMWRRSLDNSFQEVVVPIPLPYQWAPSESIPPFITLRHEQVLDFGILREAERQFSPLLHSYTAGFNCFVAPNECVRYGLEIVSDNFASKRLQVFEVAWKGQWSNTEDPMSHCLHIREV
jgi:hypothetical protein